MILPTKHLREDQALISVGAELLRLLDEPKTVSRLWEDLKRVRHESSAADWDLTLGRTSMSHYPPKKPANIPFDWFVLALDFLYLLGAVELRRGRIQRAGS